MEEIKRELDSPAEPQEASDDEDLMDMFRDSDGEDAPVKLPQEDESDSEHESELSLASDHGDEAVPERYRHREGEQPAAKRQRPDHNPSAIRTRTKDPCPYADGELDRSAPPSYQRLLQDFVVSIWEARQAVREGRDAECFRNDRYEYNRRGDFVSYVLRRNEGATRNRLDAYIDVTGATAARSGVSKLRSRVDIAGFFGVMPSAISTDGSRGPGRQHPVKQEVQAAHGIPAPDSSSNNAGETGG